MKNSTALLKDILERNLRGERKGVVSICSSHPMVIDAAIEQSLEDGSPLLVESTSNQVDQYGGYTGMTPSDFIAFVNSRSSVFGLDAGKVIFGGDHLGPNRWQNKASAEAMGLACDLVAAYVRAGYRKIHLDASMACADDRADGRPGITEDVVAARAARLCASAEKAYSPLFPGDSPPVYIIGTEVPTPGGAKESDATISPTSPAEARRTWEVTREAFSLAGLEKTWSRVVGEVVQPGIEFGNNWISRLVPEKLADLSTIPGSPGCGFVFEAHSTDYQDEASLAKLVDSHFAILKVGPWLTFNLRQALYALSLIEEAELGERNPSRSRVREVIEATMLADPKDWIRHCHGDDVELRLERNYGLSDRVRYYLGKSEVEDSIRRLFLNCTTMKTSLGLVNQYFPQYYELFRENKLGLDHPERIVRHAVRDVIRTYHNATGFTC